MARIPLTPITHWITEAALRHGQALPLHLTERLSCSRRQARALLRQLVAAQWLQPEGSARDPRFKPGALRQVVRRYALTGLQEDTPWRRDFAPCFDTLPAEVRKMAHHAFTELLNNAIDHSGGSEVVISMRQTPLQLQLLISDDGIGLFERVCRHFAIESPSLAMADLAKGRLTTAPERHLGHGLFFTARLADVFDLHANDSAFQRRAWQPQAWHAVRPANGRGTSIFVAITLDTRRTLDEVLRSAAADQGYALDRTGVPLRLLGDPVERTLVSRAEARRAASRLSAFREVELDFDGVPEIGHAFADELFRVFAGANPALALRPVRMTPQVAAMVRSVCG